jgi:hypothetical protein
MDTPAARSRCVSTLQRLSTLTLDPAKKKAFCSADLTVR